MTDLNKDPEWGFHLNETNHSLSSPPCPKWAKPLGQQNWQKLGVVVWDARLNRVTHLDGNHGLHILAQSRRSTTWKKEGLLVGEAAYRITIPSNKKSKSKMADRPEPQVSQEEGWYLTNTIHLAPDRAQYLVSFLEHHEADLERIVKAEVAERRRILGQVYSLILGQTDKRDTGDAFLKASAVQVTESIPSSAVTIPHGKYLTIVQVAEICGVKEKTVFTWLKKGLLKGLDLPGFGQLVEEKDLQKYLKVRPIPS